MRVACVSYTRGYETYLGRLNRRQPHPVFGRKEEALEFAQKEIMKIESMGVKAKIWAPLPRHKDSGHIHIVALTSQRKLARLFPTESYVRRTGQFV